MGIRDKLSRKKKEEEPQIPLPTLDDDTYEEVVRESEMLSPEEAQAKISVMLMKPENMELMAEITKEEHRRLTALKTIGDKYNNQLIKDFVRNFLELSVSLRRGGRGEIVEVARPSTMQRETMRRGLKEMLMGRTGGGMR